MNDINAILDEIQERAMQYFDEYDAECSCEYCVDMRDKYRLVAALRVAVEALERCACDHGETIERIQAALRGEK